MSTRCPCWQKIIALFALVGVLLGTLEHEDLIFQDRSNLFAEARLAPVQASLGQSLNETTLESGSQGTFRWESHRLWLSPKHETSYELRNCAFTRNAPPAILPTGLQLNLRPGIADIVAIRV